MIQGGEKLGGGGRGGSSAKEFYQGGNSEEKSERQRERGQRSQKSLEGGRGGEKGGVGGKFRGLALRRVSQKDRNGRVAERVIPEHRGSGGQHVKVFHATTGGRGMHVPEAFGGAGSLILAPIGADDGGVCAFPSLRAPGPPGALGFRLSTMPSLPRPLSPASSPLQPRRSISLSSSATLRSSPSLGQCEHS